MQTRIYTHNVELGSGLERFIATQIHKRTQRVAERIEQVTIRLKDLNGPKGGNDKQCTVEIVQNVSPFSTSHNSVRQQLETVVVSKRSANLYDCIHRALDRAVRTSIRKARKLGGVRARNATFDEQH